MRRGSSRDEALKFRDDIVRGYAGGADVADDSGAWHECRAAAHHSCGIVKFMMQGKDGKEFPFQLTQTAAGSILQCERIGRMCWEKLQRGMSKDAVLAWRNAEYSNVKAVQSTTRPRALAAKAVTPGQAARKGR